eukprot:scaffold169688_cov29-Tisochrysis_lutea.AAC.7
MADPHRSCAQASVHTAGRLFAPRCLSSLSKRPTSRAPPQSRSTRSSSTPSLDPGCSTRPSTTWSQWTPQY